MITEELIELIADGFYKIGGTVFLVYALCRIVYIITGHWEKDKE